jgi:gluconate 5-dehydrogenase
VAAFDVADPDAVRSGVAAVQASFGPVDILVNNAGIQHRAPIVDFSDADWRRLMATNLDAPFYMARAVIPGDAGQARRQDHQHRFAGVEPGAADDGALPDEQGRHRDADARASRSSSRPHDIQVNAIAPGFFRTEMNTALTTNAEFTAWVESERPRGAGPSRTSSPARGLPRLARRRASSPARCLYVDGGFTAGM